MPLAPKLSLVIPVYCNEPNIQPLMVALEKLYKKIDDSFEVVFVIDGSPDKSGDLIIQHQKQVSFASQVIFHSRNFGSFNAIRTGLQAARGNYFAVMAADLQEPVELVEQFFSRLKSNEVDITFGVRRTRKDGLLSRIASNLFWDIYRKFVLPEMPKGGVDIFGCNKEVREVLMQIEESNSSLIAQLFWVGFRREFIGYDREKRKLGKSAWTFSKKIKYLLDSILSFTDLPILLVLWIGVIGTIFSLLYIFYTIVARLYGLIDTPGYATTNVIVAFFGFLSLLVQGVIGSYVWRTFENTRKRPLTIVRKSTVFPKSAENNNDQ